MRPWRSASAVVVVLALVVVSACGRPEAARDDSTRRSGSSRAPASSGSASSTASASSTTPASSGASIARTTTPPEKASRPKIVILGDSLTAGLGLPIDQSYPALLQERLNSEGMNYDIVNAGVSGDTSAGGLARLDWALQGDVRMLVVALGGNDALRGLPPEALKRNLAQIIERAQARNIHVVLAGMEAPPNYGRDYIVSFHKVYPELAREYHVPLVPFLLQNVGGIDRLNQPDGIHPNAAGARIVADNVWAVLKPLVEGRSGS
jgi:acyl-CoA thioesterase I